MVPLAGPIVAAVVATAAAPDRVVGVLLFLAALRVLQDYVIYPRLIKRTLHLHPLAVVLAIWAGAAWAASSACAWPFLRRPREGHAPALARVSRHRGTGRRRHRPAR